MNIGEQIRKYRKEAGISQAELGKRLGVSQQQIAQYETGKRTPKIETIANIAGALGVGIKRLYPEYSREEWKKTKTYKQSRLRYEKAILGVIVLLSFKYKNIKKYKPKNDTDNEKEFYTITIEGTEYFLDFEILSALIHFCTEMIPNLFDMLRQYVPLQEVIFQQDDETGGNQTPTPEQPPQE